MSGHDSQDYTANGPSAFGFRTGGARIKIGVHAVGIETGVLGVGVGEAGSSAIPFGVIGRSDVGAGVLGVADSGDAVRGQAQGGIGIRGTSTSDRGGVFRSDEAAQINLDPVIKDGPPKEGRAGDLLALIVRDPIREHKIGPHVELGCAFRATT